MRDNGSSAKERELRDDDGCEKLRIFVHGDGTPDSFDKSIDGRVRAHDARFIHIETVRIAKLEERQEKRDNIASWAIRLLIGGVLLAVLKTIGPIVFK